MISKLWLFSLSFLLLTSAFAAPSSFNPKKTETSFFKVNSSYELGTYKTKVKGVGYSFLTEIYTDEGHSFTIDTQLFKRARKLSKSVFKAISSDNSYNKGTAFHAGDNFILTAFHVFSSDGRNKKRCLDFKILIEHNNDEVLECKKVHYCNPELDICLIEMEIGERGTNLSKLKSPIMSDKDLFKKDDSLMAIGNTKGFGLHASKGIGHLKNGEFGVFYAPVFAGNSGGPLFNDKDEIVGLVKAESKEKYGDDAFNVSVPMRTIKADLLKSLPSKIFKKLNFKS